MAKPLKKKHSIPEYDELAAVLQKQDAKPIVIQRKDFVKFIPLYQQQDFENMEPDERDHFRDLSQEYKELIIDLYKPITIVEQNEVLLTLPPIHLQAKVISREFDAFVGANAMAQQRGGDVQSDFHKNQAFANVMAALAASQDTPENLDRIRKARTEYEKIMAEFEEFQRQSSSSSKVTSVDTDDSDDSYLGEDNNTEVAMQSNLQFEEEEEL